MRRWMKYCWPVVGWAFAVAVLWGQPWSQVVQVLGISVGVLVCYGVAESYVSRAVRPVVGDFAGRYADVDDEWIETTCYQAGAWWPLTLIVLLTADDEPDVILGRLRMLSEANHGRHWTARRRA